MRQAHPPRKRQKRPDDRETLRAADALRGEPERVEAAFAGALLAETPVARATLDRILQDLAHGPRP